MTTRPGHILWLVVIYGLSVAAFGLLALFTRMLLGATWQP
jgi:hypothetical protein